jgi:hypothetical protein
MVSFSRVSTGIDGLDEILNYLQTGDNVVMQVDEIDDYRSFVASYVKTAFENNERVVYMRFARHEPLLDPNGRITIYKLNADAGFESFSTQVHNIIRQEGRDVFYVFDCLSDLLLAWATDLMIGNFFVITCPYLFELNTVAYFAILRGRHSFKTVARIRETTQVLLDVYNYQGTICIHPLKAWNRYSPTMFLPHMREGDRFMPLTSSVDASSLFSYLADKSSVSAERQLDYWDRIFLRARELLGDASPDAADEKQKMVEQLSRVLIGREKRMLSLVREYFSLEDILEIKDRLIGTGFIGGKSVGMLLARNILGRDTEFDWPAHLEIHDSYYIGSDVFYSYMVQNGWWKLLMAHKTQEGYFEVARELKSTMLRGVFPAEVKEQFQLMLEYYGQSPIIVRSSSLLEDAFGNAFAGKYESFFCANQGTPEQRYENFEEAVRHLRQHDERGRPGLPLPARPGPPGRTDGASGPARLGILPAALLLSRNRRRGPLVQHLRLEAGHGPEGGHAAPGLRPRDARRQPRGKRLSAHRGPRRPAGQGPFEPQRRPSLLPARGGHAEPAGKPV